MMKILYVPGPYPFCYYYRGYLPGVYSGQMVVSDFVSGTDINIEKIATQAREADVVVMQRPCEPKRIELMKALKNVGKKIIFENDDTYLPGKGIPLHRLENNQQRRIAMELYKYVKQALKLADGAIASTPTLALEYQSDNKNVAVLKNCIDPMDEFDVKKNTTGKFRIGFVGSVTSNDDYIHIKDQIRKIDERGDITIVVLGNKRKDGSIMPGMKDDFAFWGSLKNVEWWTYVPVTDYMFTLSQMALDLAVIPRKENYFNECKSNLKFLEMSLLKIPVLAQGFANGKSPYQGKDEEYLTLVMDNGTWYDKIIHIKDNIADYQLLAEKAHDYVLRDYNIKTYAKEWTKTISTLLKSKSKSA